MRRAPAAAVALACALVPAPASANGPAGAIRPTAPAPVRCRDGDDGSAFAAIVACDDARAFARGEALARDAYARNAYFKGTPLLLTFWAVEADAAGSPDGCALLRRAVSRVHPGPSIVRPLSLAATRALRFSPRHVAFTLVKDEIFRYGFTLNPFSYDDADRAAMREGLSRAAAGELAAADATFSRLVRSSTFGAPVWLLANVRFSAGRTAEARTLWRRALLRGEVGVGGGGRDDELAFPEYDSLVQLFHTGCRGTANDQTA